jgi:ssDNA-binding Zn-finger/Zn-ribbon topoisomerase 1
MKDSEIKDLIARAKKSRAAIIEHSNGKKDVIGNMPCPICNKGRLYYGIAPNGHIHARCATDNCLNFME